ncbi:MAG: ribosome-associated translation inhibitor RaiA [Arenicellales bacterium]|jgi:putative sigma-54 modulation protein|nr:ribosome-associated translation inhibitor RaiA [Arenicellales bacterium]HCV21205.1 ribosome-associated translation inhibitor RaiA [Gammaproteobacteria bacterium]MDP6530449.1 ribosome-associated translation inhibitor RaiA [Arenicellales bacterium]MDP7119447.1 ribosome-associated translation inhibitor RaiA [Arenicellales bacterium]MDP7192713.1 ribosome-associated translation inhibitor RaiA [Arenicellales bacterium]|tara:strand:+ start:606 stop:935 length:330 start_codon:yes stop_codon:yes gene_type:complete
MQLSITGQHLEITQALKDYVGEKMDRVERHFDEVIKVHIVLHVEKTRHLAEVTINTKGAQLHATGTAQSMYAAIDAMADKLDRQVTRRKEKAADHHQVDGGIKTMKLES